jgi:hypothetical protein
MHRSRAKFFNDCFQMKRTVYQAAFSNSCTFGHGSGARSFARRLFGGGHKIRHRFVEDHALDRVELGARSSAFAVAGNLPRGGRGWWKG